MPNKFYAQDGFRAERVKDLFGAIASRYDLINDLQSFALHRYWKRQLVRLAGAKPNDRVLDLCCGTGDVVRLFEREGGRVVGLDFSGPMLEQAQERQLSAAFLRGDALRLPFRDESFDIVTISYGLRNLADVEAGLREMRRVTRPGGRLLVLDFGKPENRVWRSFYFAYLKHAVPLFGRIFCGDSETHAYILESLRNYPAQKGVAAVMKRLQLEPARVVNFLGGAMSINCGQLPRRSQPA
jgi:demethylmenaquinone methyltransferase/2-methoxy-6-polyprenyl-1,4-benzoquinol methylase